MVNTNGSIVNFRVMPVFLSKSLLLGGAENGSLLIEIFSPLKKKLFLSDHVCTYLYQFDPGRRKSTKFLDILCYIVVLITPLF